jgi:hypothetical protein
MDRGHQIVTQTFWLTKMPHPNGEQALQASAPLLCFAPISCLKFSKKIEKSVLKSVLFSIHTT